MPSDRAESTETSPRNDIIGLIWFMSLMLGPSALVYYYDPTIAIDHMAAFFVAQMVILVLGMGGYLHYRRSNHAA